MNLNKAIKSFNEYTDNYDKKVMQINMKYNHSFAVMRLMEELADRLDLDENDKIIAKLIGLLHDIGRFEQFKRYSSFSDKNVDHADMSCIYLFDEGHIRDFIEEKDYDLIIESAIRYHNKMSIPDNLSDRELLFCKMIRDMDKVDIYKQTATYYEYEFKADDVNSEVLKAFSEERQIPMEIVKSSSDKVLINLGFIFDINFDDSFDILVETDNFDLFLSMVNVDSNSEKLWKKLREICFDKINRGV